MKTAISFSQNSDQLSWVDLRVFAHNKAGINLYQSLGFQKTGSRADQFRIEGEKIGDMSMSLEVAYP